MSDSPVTTQLAVWTVISPECVTSYCSGTRILSSNPNRDINVQVCLYLFSHVQGAPSYVGFRRFDIADNGRAYSSRMSSAIAQSITMLTATLSDLLVSLNRLMSGRFEVLACTERMPKFELISVVACCQLYTASVCSPDSDVEEHLTHLTFFVLESIAGFMEQGVS